MFKNKWFWVSLCLAVLVVLQYAQKVVTDTDVSGTPRIAFIVGGPDQFWQRTANGARDSAKQFGALLEVIVPDEGGADQTRQLRMINAEKFDGVAISPLQPEEQTREISRLATQIEVVTFDNDAPDSVRRAHVGTNNYVAGTLFGQLVKEALPDGGKIAIFVGDHKRENAILRRQGLVDALRGKTRTPGSDLDPVDQPVTAGEYTIVKTYLDGSSQEVAKENAALALEEIPELEGMIALYGYNGPMCLEALEDADKLGTIKVVAFDEHDATLAGIEAGHVQATVVQAPYQYGYEAVRVLVQLTQKGNESAMPLAARGEFYLPCIAVRPDNLAQFRSELELQSKGSSSNSPAKRY